MVVGKISFRVISVVITGNTAGLTGALTRAAGQVDVFGNRVRGANAETSRLGSLAKGGAAVGVAALGIALVAAASSAVEFQARMYNVASLDEHVRQNFQATSQAVLDMSKHLPQSANTLAEGLYNIASSGFYGRDAMHVLETSAIAASAGLTDTNTASKAIVASLNAYGLEAGDATRVSDALFSTVNYGVLSFEALTGAIAHSVGNAAQAGVSIEELGTAIATMTRSGLSASEAGVSVNNMMAKLLKPSKALTETFIRLGINLQRDLKDPAIGLHGVMLRLQDAADGNVRVWQSWFPEIRALRGALALMANEAGTYDEIFGHMGTQTRAAGAAMAVFAVQSQSTKHQLIELKNQFVATGIELGLRLLPYIERAAHGLSALLDGAKGTAREVGGYLRPTVVDLGGAMRNTADIAGDLWDAFGPFIGLAAKLGLGAVVTGLHGVASAAQATTGFLSDHERLVYAIAAAWVVVRLPWIIAQLRMLAVAAQGQALAMLATTMVSLGNAANFAAARLAFFGTGLRGALVGLGVYGLMIGAAAVAFDDLAHGAERAKGKVDALTSGLDANSVESLDRTIGALVARYKDLGGAGGQIGVSNREQGREIKALEDRIRELTRVKSDLIAKEQQATANTQALANAFGMTTEQVKALADKAHIDLAGSLVTVDQSGKNAIDRFRSLTTSLLGAQIPADQVGEAIKAIDNAASGADAAVKELTITMDIFTGRGVEAEAAIDAVEKGFIELAKGTGLAQGSLFGYSETALESRSTIRGEIEAITAAAAAYAKKTGSVDAGREMYDAYIERLKFTLVQEGKNRAEVEKLFAAYSTLPEAVATAVSAPGAVTAKNQVDALRVALDSIANNKTITV
uniref:phage tail tape measure protein n=1 Tax=Candidatus Protofrankia californiensis TaxID=1839754 RepID=UPI0010414EC2